MTDFDALGRDVAAAADSTFHTNEGGAVGGAVKALWTACGFDKGDNPNHLWTVSFTHDESGFQLVAVLKDANVYVDPGHPDIPASADELARSGAGQEPAAPSDVPADVPAPEPASPVVEPEPAAAPVEDVPADVPVDAPAVEGDTGASGPAA